MIRHLSVALLLAVAAQGQVRFHFGVEAGVPLTNTLSGSSVFSSPGNGYVLLDSFSSNTKRLLIGPTVRVDLPFGLGVQVDGLYQRINYEHFFRIGIGTGAGNETFSHNTADRWQFPLLIQYSPRLTIIKLFVEAGPSLSYITNGHNLAVYQGLDSFDHRMFSSETNHLIELRHNTVAGVTAGLGVDLHPWVVHIRPEFRYTRWTTAQFSYRVLSDQDFPTPFRQPPAGIPSISSKRDQIDFLLGVTF
jgi:Outer membrane protein beta-barrel domain